MYRSISPFIAALLSVGACADVQVLSDVPYDDRHGDATTLDIYLPAGDALSRPAVLLIHGGGWRRGSKDGYALDATRLAQAGYVAVSMGYRLVPDAIYPAQMQDSFCALSYLRAHADDHGIDPDRIAVMGYSAGGHLASLVGLAADVVEFTDDCPWGPTGPAAAVVSGAGPQDLRDMAGADVIQEFMGGTLDEVPERYDLASPITHIDADAADAPPFLFIHGTGDLFVDIEQSERADAALDALGVDSRLLSIAGAGHVLNQGTDNGTHYLMTSTSLPVAWTATIDFLDRTIGPVGGAR